MIKFFRHLRQQLVMENKTGKPALPAGKYLKYAIGEILLVVIVILIAVQINTWANESKLNADNKVFLEKMITELELNKSRMELLIIDAPDPKKNSIIGLEQAVRNCETLLQMTYRGLTISDTTFIFNKRLDAGGSYLNLHSSVYDELINTGKLYTIGSDSIETAIKEYYKRCKRENLYNKRFTGNMFDGMHMMEDSYYKILLDHDKDKPNFKIENYDWFTNSNSTTFQNFQIAVDKIGWTQTENLLKIKQIQQYSDRLIYKIEKELKEYHY